MSATPRKRLLEIFEQLSSFGKEQLIVEAARILSSETEILKPHYNLNTPSHTDEGNSNIFENELIPQAIRLALEYEQISISMLQRRLGVGYARAARIIDDLETNFIVSPTDGSKPRQVPITWEDYHRIFGDEL